MEEGFQEEGELGIVGSGDFAKRTTTDVKRWEWNESGNSGSEAGQDQKPSEVG